MPYLSRKYPIHLGKNLEDTLVHRHEEDIQHGTESENVSGLEGGEGM